MAKVIGAIAAVLVGMALATGVAMAVTSAAGPDKNVNFTDPAVPNNSGVGASGDEVNYGTSQP